MENIKLSDANFESPFGKCWEVTTKFKDGSINTCKHRAINPAIACLVAFEGIKDSVTHNIESIGIQETEH